MKFMSNTAVVIVIAAFAACAAGAVYDSAEETAADEPLGLRMRRACTSVCGAHGCQINCQRMKREDLAVLEADAEEPLRLRMRRVCTSVCGQHGCQINCQRMKREDLAALDIVPAEEADAEEPLQLRMRRVCTSVCGQHGCQINCQRMKREDLAVLDAALGVYEDETSNQIGNLRARRSSDADSAEEADAAEPLRLRMRRTCTSVCGWHGCQINCQRMKREDLAVMDAALGVYEDANDDAMPIRARRNDCMYGIGSDGKPFSICNG